MLLDDFEYTFDEKENLKENWYQGETLNAAIGQGYLLSTPLQLAVMTARIATNGKRVKPIIIKSNKKKSFKNPNEVTFIPKGAIHRIENLFNKAVQIVEVQTGSILKESDIVRYKDIYGRVN